MVVATTNNSLFALDSINNNIDIIKEIKDNKNTILEAVRIDEKTKKIAKAPYNFDLCVLNAQTLIQKANKLYIPR